MPEAEQSGDKSPHSKRLGAKGQGNVWRTIINQIPPHRTYIEAFAGWGTIFFKKRLAERSILIDRDPARVVELLEQTEAKLPGVDVREELEFSVLSRQFSSRTTNGGATATRRQDTAIEPLRTERLTTHDSSVDLVNAAALPFLQAYQWQGNEFVYCDPPYPLETRTSSHRYLFEMADDPDNDLREHAALLDCLKTLPCPVMVSSYHSALYAIALKDWRMISFRAMSRGGERTEHLWMNYPQPVELHDYRWLGETHRQRLDLNRLKKRWLPKLQKMPALKRQALLGAIQEM